MIKNGSKKSQARFLSILSILFLVITIFLIPIKADTINPNKEDVKYKVSNSTYIDEIRSKNSTETVNGFTKDYISSEKRLKIKEGGKTSLDMNLESDYTEVVMVLSNESLVAWFNLKDFSGNKFVDEVKFFDVKNNYTEINRSYSFKYKLDEPIVKKIDENSSEIEEWKEFNSLSELPKKNIEIGLFMELYSGDKIEWVMNKEGFNIYEWAIVVGTNSGFVTTVPTSDPGGANKAITDFAYATADTAPDDGSISEIGFYVGNGGDNGLGVEVGIYADDAPNHEPGALLAKVSDTFDMTIGWHSIPIDYSVSNGVNYWIAVQIDHSTDLGYVDYASSGGTGYVGTFHPQTALPDPDWGSSYYSDTNGVMAFYALWESPPDLTPPYFTTIPSNVSGTYGSANVNADFNAADETGFGGFYLNDTSNFTINYATGVLTNKTPLFVGSYALNVTINDTSQNINWTIFTVQVGKAVPKGTVSGTSPITYGNAGNVEGSESNNGDADISYKLYRDGKEVSNPDGTTLAVDTYSYIWNATAGYNYTANASMGTFSLTVNQNTGICGVYFNASSPITYPATFIAYTNCSSAYTFYKNGTSINNGTTINSGAGAYNISVFRTDTENYTSTYSEREFQVTQATNGATVAINPSNSVNYGTETTASCSVDYGTPTLYRNAVGISTPDVQTFAVGSYDYTCNVSGNQNYTSAIDEDTLTVNKASLSASITNDRTDTFTYDGTPANIGISESNSGDTDVTYKLYVNNIDKGSSYSQAAAGAYSIILNSTGGANYSSSASLDTLSLTINKDASICGVQFNETSPLQYPGTFLVWSNCTSAFTLKKNDSVISNNTEQALAEGAYNFSVFRTDTANYSSVYSERQFIIGPEQDLTPPYFTSIPSNASGTYNILNVNADFDATDDGSFGGFYLNDTSNFTINYATGVLTNKTPLFANSYALNVTINDSELNINWTIFTVIVNQAVPQGTLSGASPITYGNAGNVEGAESNTGDGGVSYTLFRNGTSVSNPDTTTLSAGFYSYIWNTTGAGNYTLNASMDTFDLTVNKDSSSNCQVLFNETSPLSYLKTFLVYSDCNSAFTLRRNGTIIENNSEQSLAVGTYNFSVQRTDTANYSNTFDDEYFELNDPFALTECQTLNAAGTYTLQNNIDNYGSSCFIIQASSVTLDCDNYHVDGNDGVDDYGVDATNGDSNLEIRDCAFTDWDIGIWAEGDYMTFSNVSSSSNRGNGIRIQKSTNGNFTNIRTYSNGQIDPSAGFYIDSMNNSYFENIVSYSNTNVGFDMTLASSYNILRNSIMYGNDNYGVVNELVSSHNVFENINSSENLAGMAVNIGGQNISIINLTADTNDEAGIFVVKYTDVRIYNSSFQSNFYTGPYIENSTSVVLDGITTHDNTYEGVWLIGVNDSNFTNIYSHDNGNNGFNLAGGNANNISNVSIVDNIDGLWFQSLYGQNPDNNYIINLYSSGNDHGFYVAYGDGNTLINSTIENSGTYGIQFDYIGTGNAVYNNLLNNTNNVEITNGDGANSWNTTQQAGQRVFGSGVDIGGNYYTNSTSNGYSDTCDDSNTDGICNSAINVHNETEGCISNNCDYLPLSAAYSPDTCTYNSGNWVIDCSDNCVIDGAVDLDGNNISITGTGTFVMAADISNFVTAHITGTDSSNKCLVYCIGGCLRGENAGGGPVSP